MSRDWRKEARSLAEDFQKAQSRRVPTLPAPTVYQAIEDMQRIERQAEDLRREIAEERLPPGVRSEIERILSVIPPPS